MDLSKIYVYLVFLMFCLSVVTCEPACGEIKNCITKRKRMKQEPPDYPFPPGFMEQHYSSLLVQQSDSLLPLAPLAEGSELHDFNCAMASIKAKHGDIDKDCTLSSEWMRKMILFGICKLLCELQEKQLDELELASLQPYYIILQDYERLNIDVSWLVKRLDEIKDAIVSRDETQNLRAIKKGHLQDKEEKEEKVRRLRKELKEAEDELAAKEQMIHKLDREISHKTSKFQPFQTRSLVGGLI